MSALRNDVKLADQTHFGMYSREKVLDVYRIFDKIDKYKVGVVDVGAFMKEFTQTSSMQDVSLVR